MRSRLALALISITAGVGCGPTSDSPDGASSDHPDAASAIPDVPDIPDIPDARTVDSRTSDSRTSDGPDIPDVPDARTSDAPDVPDARTSDAPDVPDARTSDAPDVPDARTSDAPDVPDARTSDAPDVPDARTSDAPDVPDAAASDSRTSDARTSDAASGEPDAAVPGTVVLTVTKAPDATGAGTVASMPAGLTCGPGCVLADATFAGGAQVTLAARPVSGSYFAGWTGACAGQGRVCMLNLFADATARARFTAITHNLAFVTSDRFAGDLGGLDGADDKCAQAAAEAGIVGRFVALLSTGQIAARDRLVVPGGAAPARGFVRLDGRPIADTVADLFDRHVLWYPVLFDQDGLALRSTTAGGEDMTWTGTDPSGPAGHTCSDWTSSAADVSGNAGQPGAGPAVWLTSIAGFCKPNGVWGDNRLYCFMIDHSAQVAAPAATGKLIYLTRSAFDLNGGRDAADMLCDAEKPPGAMAVRALLATTTEAAADALVPAQRYVRPDGVAVGTGADLVAASRDERELDTGIWQTGDGGYAFEATGRYAWTGVPRGAGLDEPGTTASTCGDWASPDPVLTGAPGDFQFRDASALTGDPSYPCFANLLRLICVEQ